MMCPGMLPQRSAASHCPVLVAPLPSRAIRILPGRCLPGVISALGECAVQMLARAIRPRDALMRAVGTAIDSAMRVLGLGSRWLDRAARAVSEGAVVLTVADSRLGVGFGTWFYGETDH